MRVNGRPTDDMLEPLRKGITVDGEDFQPMTVTLDRQQGANAWLTVGLREGKNREIRRAMEAVNLSVNRLIRTSYGPFQLGELKTGEVEELKRKVVRDQLGLEIADTTGTAIKKKPARIIKRKARKPGEPGPGRPGLPKEPGDKTATGETIPGKPKPGYGKSKPARPASDPAPRKFGTRVKSTRKP